ncbi:MAG: serine/threonine-protein kinase [Isosphaeraceae bacterium]
MSQGNIGERLGSFRLEETLGSGAMGVVFRATHETTGRPAAVKIVHGELAQKGKVFERFEREAEILKQFRHPNIVRWLAWGRFRGTSYFAMEYVEGATLERVLQERGELSWREVVDLAIQLADALQYAHDMNVVHRDLKPSNLMIMSDGRLKLTDFGIAKDLERTTQLTAPGRTLGTAAYMAPEQIRGTPAVSHKTDLYSLGILIYQMLTGKAPFEGSSAVVLMHCHLNEPPPRPGDKVGDLPRELDDLVVKLMAKAPADRPWDAAAVKQVLDGLKEKDQRGEPIDMVWPPADSPDSHPTRAGVGGPAAPKRKKGRKSGTFSSLISSFTSRDHDPSGLGSKLLLNKAMIETLGLGAALVAVGGFMGYWLWPPSASYLHRQATTLMASSHRSDWINAQEEYLDVLDRKHPDHPFKSDVRKWRDRIALDEANGRAKVLDSPVHTQLSEPRTNTERHYVSFSTLAAKASAEGNDTQAAELWREMARLMGPDDREERKWHLLANRRAEEIESRMREQRSFVVDQIARADEALQAGRPSEAVAIRAMLKEKYGQYTDLADLLGTRPAPAHPDQGSAPAQAPEPHSGPPSSSAVSPPEPPAASPEPAPGTPPHRPATTGKPAGAGGHG